ncbi:N-acetylmuramoyl-L-alanine amidase [Clostridium beijerinckii]|uniref:N-acetylmuramoyl-L-alanine amidase n=1 Tax=Clostridium beijerinckii TaxID=1520 RepID=UPI00183EA440|nr:N-acetylmuramoyl-L-alanine amidase [Clostridium beijerinckii]NOW07874.1 hypothetical protein [Clostridium beijerinckii]NYC05432.1 hypothetical protein [Clostridium beijerinckii]NYC05505.1 hypothetical protein [Clostridium beijerinckii]
MDDKNYILGVIDSPVDLRDYDYSMISSSSEKIDIPEEFILDYDYPILCQGQVGSCVAHALSEMKSYIDAVSSNDMYSVGFIYANRQENDYKGTGMVTREALRNLVKFGDCKKTSFPVNEEYPSIVTTLDKYNKEKLLDEADDHKSLAYISLSKEDIKEYLVKYKKPILLTCYVYSNFYEADTNKGIIPSVPSGNKQGSHAMLCIGYKEDALILINSWGDWNGDQGKYYLDIDSNIIKELWALEDIKNVKVPEVKIYKVGWNKNDKGWWYSEDGNTYYEECWKQIKESWYYFNNEGYAVDGDWIQYKNKWYYLEKDTCAMAADKWILWKGKWYRVGNDGAMLIGWFQDNDTNWYYLDIDKGYTYTDCTILIDGKNYSFDSNGKWIKNTTFNCIDVGLDFGSMNMTNNPNILIVHHIEAEGPNWTVEMIHNMHKNENGWAGIGYHYYIRLDGSVYKGRPSNAIGAHCQGANTNSLGIAFEGNYDTRTQMPEAQYNSWCQFKAYLCNKYGNMPVYGHREKGSSECPGKYFPLDKIKNA